MKGKADDARRLLDRWNPDIRLVLLHGPDESLSRELASAFVAKLSDPGDPLSVTVVSPAALREDPGRLPDEAAAVGMFGGAKAIRLDGAGEECAEAVALLLAAPVAGNPVIATAGTLRKDGKLRAAAEASPLALAVESFAAGERDAGRAATTRAADLGLRPSPAALRLLLQSSGGDRAVLARELEKFALFLDASPDDPKRLEPEHLAALGADAGEGEQNALVAALLAGDRAALERQLALLRHEGVSAIPVLRALARRLTQLIDLAAQVEAGLSPAAAVDRARPPVFWKEKEATAALLGRWRAGDLAACMDMALAAERAVKAPGSAGDRLAWQALVAAGEQAARRRSQN